MSKPVKVRLSTNATGSGVNAASYVPSFRYPSLHDALSIIQPGDFIAIGDIKRYYIAFPFATEAYYNFGVEIANKVYYYLIARFWHLGHLWPQQDHPSAKICEMVYEKTEKPFSPYLPISLSPYLPIPLSPFLPFSLFPFLPVLRPLSSVLCLLSSVLCLLSSVFCLLSSVFCPLSSEKLTGAMDTIGQSAALDDSAWEMASTPSTIPPQPHMLTAPHTSTPLPLLHRTPHLIRRRIHRRHRRQGKEKGKEKSGTYIWIEM